MSELRISEIKRILSEADLDSFAAIERSLQSDTRKGVQAAVESTRRRLEKEAREARRLKEMYEFERGVISGAHGKLAVGLDEVGRGPLAGPLSVGAVVLDLDEQIDGLNDSKKLSESRRDKLSTLIKDRSIAHTVVHIPADYIDSYGMTASLKTAFTEAIREIESQGIVVDVVLLDGNPLHLDDREINIIKGDSKCPSIAAASIIAKVERDNLMKEYAKSYPQYGFDIHKGYGTEAHRNSIREFGLCGLHRKSFCSEFTQQSLF